MLCTHLDPIVFTFIEYTKIKSFVSKGVTCNLYVTHFETNDLIFVYSMNVNTMGSQCVHSTL